MRFAVLQSIAAVYEQHGRDQRAVDSAIDAALDRHKFVAAMSGAAVGGNSKILIFFQPFGSKRDAETIKRDHDARLKDAASHWMLRLAFCHKSGSSI